MLPYREYLRPSVLSSFTTYIYLLFAEPDVQLAEKERREGSEKVYDERMDMIMEVRVRMGGMVAR